MWGVNVQFFPFILALYATTLHIVFDVFVVTFLMTLRMKKLQVRHGCLNLDEIYAKLLEQVLVYS